MSSSAAETLISAPAPALGKAGAALWVLLLWIVSTGLQYKNGAFTADLAGDPDEPAHTVTTLMMRDYFACGLTAGEHPLHFAKRYYDHYPKVAIGHYPPLFYVVAGAWMLPFPTKTALMLFISLLCAVLGALTTSVGLRCGLCKATALITGLWFVLLPFVQKQTVLVMSDLMLAVWCLLAAGAFAAFIRAPNAWRALLFGVLAACAILTKASAVALALVPPLAIVLLGRWRLLVNWRLWLAPLPVLATALPWTLLTMKITEEGMQRTSIAEYIPAAVQFYAGAFWQTFGPVILIAAAISIVIGTWRLFAKKVEANVDIIVAAALAISVTFLYLVSPTGFSARYLLPLTPLMLVAAAMLLVRLRQCWSLGAGAALSLVLLGAVPPKNVTGFGTLAADLIHRAPSGAKVLVSSDARGEGGLIAELALRDKHRCNSSWTIVRASKFMAESGWTGSGYQALFKTEAEFLAALRRDGITWIVEDTGVESHYETQHNRQLAAWSSRLSLVCTIPARRMWEMENKPLLLHAIHSVNTERQKD